MNRLQRQRLVFIVWSVSIVLALAGAVFAIVISTPPGGIIGSTLHNPLVGSVTPILMILFMWTPLVTAIIWTLWSMFNHRQPKQDTQDEAVLPQNTPMSYKMALLLEMMDDDEREALKQDLRRQILADENNSNAYSQLMVEETEKRKRG